MMPSEQSVVLIKLAHLRPDGTTLLTDKHQILQRWAKHFESVLNRPSNISDEAINHLLQVPINHELDVLPTHIKVE